MTPEARTDRPLIWAHANTPAAIDAIREVLMRAQLSDPTLSYVLTTSDSAVTFAPDVVVLDEADAEVGFGLAVRDLARFMSVGAGQCRLGIVWPQPSPVNSDPVDKRRNPTPVEPNLALAKDDRAADFEACILCFCDGRGRNRQPAQSRFTRSQYRGLGSHSWAGSWRQAVMRANEIVLAKFWPGGLYGSHIGCPIRKCAW
jgi:hypothetical protein